MRTILLLIACLCASASMTVMASGNKQTETFNYQRGVEAMQNRQPDEALEYFQKDLEADPKSGYSWSWVAIIHHQNEKYGEALNAANLSIRYLPKTDKGFLGSTYHTRSRIYLSLEDTAKALLDLTKAISLYEDNKNMLVERADIYIKQGQFDLAEADYRRLIAMNEGDVTGYMGLGRIEFRRGHFDETIAQCTYVLKLDEKHYPAYLIRAEAEMQKQMWNEATDDLISALKLSWNNRVATHIVEMEDPAFGLMLSKLKIQAAKDPSNAIWNYLSGCMYVNRNEYNKALEQFFEANRRQAGAVNFFYIASCYYYLGNNADALMNINQTLCMDSTDVYYMDFKAGILYEMGNVKAAIAVLDNALTVDPESFYIYNSRGCFREQTGDLEGAEEDFTMSVVTNPNYSYAYFRRARVCRKLGKKEQAEADFRKVIELENSPENYECIQYAYLALGEPDKAMAVMDTIIARDTTNDGSYYDAACLYCLMNEQEKSLAYLEKALELGFRRFGHMDRDDDLDQIRNTDAYRKLIEKYKAVSGQEPAAVPSSGQETVTTEVPFTKEGDMCKVRCSVNGLPLHFIFDTGAATVSISKVEATFMLKNGYLNEKDVIGSARFVDANGDVSVGTMLNLKHVNFGGLELDNVRASVVRNQVAPLLLGQSVLSRLGKIEIDNNSRVLKITHSK